MKRLLLLLLLALSSVANGAYVNIRTGWPMKTEAAGYLSSTISTVIETQNEGLAGCFYMPETATITTAVFTVHAATNGASIADNSYTVSIQDMGATGLPSGTPMGGASPASATFPQSGAAGGVTLGPGTVHPVTLSNSVTINGGTPYCVVVQHTGATDAVNFINLRNGYQASGSQSYMPYTTVADTAGTWTKSGATFPMGFSIRSASRSYGLPLSGTGNIGISPTTEAGFLFTLPDLGSGSTVKVCGLNILQGTASTAGTTVTVTLYSSPTTSPTIVQQVSIDTDHVAAIGAGSRGHNITFSSPVSISTNATYGIGVAIASGSWSWTRWTQGAAIDLTAYPLGGFTGITRTLTDYPPSGNDTNAFTSTATDQIVSTLQFCDLVPGAGGGGSMGGTF